MENSLEYIMKIVSDSDVRFLSNNIRSDNVSQFNVTMTSKSARRIGIDQKFEFRFDLDDMNIVGQFADGRKIDYSMRLELPFGPPGRPPAYLRCRRKPYKFIADILYSVLYEERERCRTPNGVEGSTLFH